MAFQKRETFEVINNEDYFYCRQRRKYVGLEKCLNDFVDANAFENKRSACYRCPQGRKIREEFSEMKAR